MIITHNGTILKHEGTILTKITEVPPQPPFTNTYSLDFDGVDDYVDLGDSDDFSFGDGATDSPFSISAWIKMDDASSFRITTKYVNANREYLFTTDSSDRLSFALYDNSNASRIQRKYNTALTSFQGQWINVIGTYDGSSLSSGIKIYLNGTRVDDIDGNLGTYIAMENTTQPLEIGRRDVTSFSNGKIDEVAIFDDALTPTEITSIASAPTDLTDLSPIAWYRMGDNGSYKSPQWLLPNNENKDKVSNYSLDFDGIDDYVSVTPNPLTDFTVSFWIKPRSGFGASYDGILGQGTTSPQGGILRYVAYDGTATVGNVLVRLGSWTNVSGTVTNGVWTNIILTYDSVADELKGYNNGSLYTTISSPDFSVQTTNAHSFERIGLRNGLSGSEFNGGIDEVALWDSALTDISSIYNGGTPTTLPSGAVAHYKMGEEANFTSNWLIDNSALDNYSKRSFEFDGIDDKIELNTQSLGITGAISVSAWVKIPTTNTGGGGTNIQQIVCEDRAGGTGRNWLLYWRGGSQNVFACAIFDSLGGSTSASSTAVVPNDNQWHHVMFTYSGDTTTNGLKLFVDGILRSQGTSVNGGLRSSPTVKPTIGGLSNVISWMFEGNIDEVAIFNTVVDVADVWDGSGEPIDVSSVSGIVSNYRMGEDASFNGTNWTVPDQVGTNTGTSANMTVDDLVGEAPNYSGGGISNAMDIEDRVGEAPNSTSNAVSFNMDLVDRVEDTP